MHRFWSRKANSLQPYTAGEQPKEKLIKLNTNENAYPPSPHVRDAVLNASSDLRLYPPADGGIFRLAAAHVNQLEREEIFCSNGSDEALGLAFMAFFDPGTPIAAADVTYSFYPVWANLFGLTLDVVPLRSDFTLDVEAFLHRSNVVLANPNAPTGVPLPEQDLRSIIESCSGVVIVDEAYAGFGATSALPWIREYPNLAVVRTLSKSYSLAGMRAGYVAASSNLVEALETVKDSFNSYPVDRLAIAAAAAALGDVDWHAQNCAQIMATRERTAQALRGMGLFVLPSAANFLFVRFQTPSANTVFQALRERGILVRYFGAERTKDFLRITVGTDEEMDGLLKSLEEIL